MQWYGMRSTVHNIVRNFMGPNYVEHYGIYIHMSPRHNQPVQTTIGQLYLTHNNIAQISHESVDR